MVIWMRNDCEDRCCAPYVCFASDRIYCLLNITLEPSNYKKAICLCEEIGRVGDRVDGDDDDDAD